MEWSVLIPTLWKSKKITKLIDDLERVKYVKEIVVMDNTGVVDPMRDGKLIIIPGKPLNYVNRSWNQLVQFCRTSHYIISNDDVYWHPFIFEELNDMDWSLNPIVGVGKKLSQTIQEQELYSEPLADMPYGWGQMIAGQKKNYVEVPEYLRIWYGDNWLCSTHSVVYGLNGFYMEGEMSVTSRDPIYDKIKEADTRRWQTMIQQGLI